MTSNGRAVTAQIEIAPGLGAVNWSNVSATLKAAVAIPPEPAQSDFVNYEGMAAVKYRYNHDPAVLAAYALQRTFAGTLHSDGTATFQDVPPGHYTLEVKLFDPDKRPPPPNMDNEPALVLSYLDASVTVPDDTGTPDANSPAVLGDFALAP